MSDDRTRWIKFAAYLCAYDTEDDVVREAAATIRELADRIKELEAKLEWQPIETAPKDGTPILLLIKSPRNAIQASFSGSCWVDCWCAFVDPYEPTHWMPLPSPPQALKEDKT